MPSALLVFLSLAACGHEPTVDADALGYGVDEKSICGLTTDFIEVEDADTGYRELAPAAGMSVWNRGTALPVDDVDWCSGALIAPNLFMTAGHCLLDCDETDIWFNFQLDGGAVDPAAVDVYACQELVESNERQTDYAILRLDGEPGAIYGWYEIDFRTPSAGEDLIIIGHPGTDRPKKVSLGAVVGSGSTSVRYQVDTESGSSGSAVLGSDGRYVAVHTNGGCNGTAPENGYNYGRRADYIRDNYPFLASYDFFDQSSSDAPDQDDSFGEAVATGDFDCDGYVDVAVSAPGESSGLGAVSVRYGSSAGPDSATEVLLTSATDEDFGAALAAGDLDGDGCEELLIGAPGASVDGAAGAGAVDIGWGSASGLSALERLDASDFGGASAEGAGLGSALATGDMDGDGLLELAAGAPGGGGAVGLLPGDIKQAASWITEDDLGLDSTEDGDRFGQAVALGDLNGDGLDDLAAGAPGESVAPPLPEAGRVTLVPGGAWGDLGDGALLLLADTPARFAAFGEALVVGDFDGDGVDDLAVGSPGATDTSGQRAGVVSVHLGGGATWERFGYPLGFALNGLRFGEVLTAGDFDGDGVDDLAVGIPGAVVGGAQSAGRVAVRYGGEALSDAVEILQQNQSAAGEGERFGAALAAGDFDGDGDADLVVGLPGQELYGLPGAGAVVLDIAE